jgi:hypothetical protein
VTVSAAVALVLAAAAALLTWLTFWKNLRLRRAEWLSRLYESFYVKPELKAVRAALDYDGEARRELLRCVESDPENAKALEPLVDYLNFFEFLAVLWTMKQLSLDEIQLLFGYYLRRLAEEPGIVKFCREGGFKNLLRMLEKLGYVGSREK